MREGTTQPAEAEVSTHSEPLPERTKPRGQAIFAPSNQQDTTTEEGVSDGLTVTDFSNLVRFSSAAIACISFPTRPACALSPEIFSETLYTIPSRCLEASTGFANNRGLSTPEVLIGKPLSYLLPIDCGFKEMFRAWRRRNFSRDGFEWDILDGQGDPLTAQVALYSDIKDDHLCKLWIVMRDISALSRAIRNASKTEKHYRNILSQEGLIFFRTYLDGTISFYTPRAQEERLINISHEDPIEEILSRACHPEDRSALDQLSFHRRSHAQKPLQVSLRLLSPRRGLLHLTLHHIPHMVSGEVDSYDIIGIESTVSAPSTEHQLSLDATVACLAHDVNNHLVVASANLELARGSLDVQHPAVGYVEAAALAVVQSAAINSQTFKVNDGIQTSPETVEVTQLFAEVVRQSTAILPKGIDLISTPLSSGLAAWADKTHVRQILLNLILNARDALAESGSITISATPRGPDCADASICKDNSICISVSDNGPGIEEQMVDMLFKPFVSTKSRDKTRGLGLAMVKTLAEKNGGTITVTSVRGMGSTFTLCLPTADQKAAARSSAPPPPLAPVPERKLSVLVADDEAQVRSTLMSALTSRGHQAVAVPSLDSLIHELSRPTNGFNVVVIDDGMTEAPISEILEVTRSLHPHIGVLITSGDPTVAHYMPRRKKNCSFLAKPFALNELYNAVESIYDTTE